MFIISFDTFNFSILSLLILSWTCVYALFIYKLSICNKFVDSDINETIAHVTAPIIIANTIINIIIELIFLFNFVLFIKNLIAGSIISEITNAIKNGI